MPTPHLLSDVPLYADDVDFIESGKFPLGVLMHLKKMISVLSVYPNEGLGQYDNNNILHERINCLYLSGLQKHYLIDLDLVRTLPANRMFADPDSEKVKQLRRVLYAYRNHDVAIGYCQGLNRIAAVALLYLEEEDAFWFLIAFTELQPANYYASSLIGAVADQKLGFSYVLRDLVAEKLPRLAAHLRHFEVDLSLFALSWFLTCCVDVMPHEIYLPIFDVFLYEGNKTLFRFVLAILKMCESAVLQSKSISTIHACLSKPRQFVSDYKSLAQVAFNDMNPFPQKQIETRRALYLSQLQASHHS
ncbi:TBC domain protein [Dictyocaulus viviparus]|uniref:TBC domain protein n=1 Tax=Dictyocaulus viviparus TaxID=29172 RepID=A0A0D8XDT3_DICVI|nr:TBC domain protein [Dictyocaulus viviparus]